MLLTHPTPVCPTCRRPLDDGRRCPVGHQFSLRQVYRPYGRVTAQFVVAAAGIGALAAGWDAPMSIIGACVASGLGLVGLARIWRQYRRLRA